MWILRDIEARLRRSARTRPVVVLTGACQTGKTSTSRRLFPRHGFVSLDLPTEAEQAEKEPEAFLRRHPAPLLIDEVQHAPRLFRHLEATMDARRGKHGQYLLTGSQKFTLMKGVSELPTAADASNLTFVRAAVGKARITAGAVVCRARHGFPLADGLRVASLADLA